MYIPTQQKGSLTRGSDAMQCPKCGRLLPVTTSRCLYCAAENELRRRQFLKRQSEGGRPFFTAAGIISLLVAALLLVGCAGDATTADVALRTESDSYRAGEEVQVRLSNHTDASVSYNICFAFLTLERSAEGDWVQVPVNLGPAPDAACTAQLNGLAPGEDAESTAYLPIDLEAGTYRLASPVEVSNARRMLQTNSFEVRSN